MIGIMIPKSIMIIPHEMRLYMTYKRFIISVCHGLEVRTTHFEPLGSKKIRASHFYKSYKLNPLIVGYLDNIHYKNVGI